MKSMVFRYMQSIVFLCNCRAMDSKCITCILRLIINPISRHNFVKNNVAFRKPILKPILIVYKYAEKPFTNSAMGKEETRVSLPIKAG